MYTKRSAAGRRRYRGYPSISILDLKGGAPKAQLYILWPFLGASPRAAADLAARLQSTSIFALPLRQEPQDMRLGIRTESPSTSARTR